MKLLILIMVAILALIGTVSAAIPPTPLDLTNIVDSDSNAVNWSWSPGTVGGNVTDSYNVSADNGTSVVWSNSSNTFYNHVLSEPGTSWVEVWAYNSSGAGNLSAVALSGNQDTEVIPLLFHIFLILAILVLILTGYSVLYEDLVNFTHIISGLLASVLWFILGYQAYIGIGFEHVVETCTYSSGLLVSATNSVVVVTYQYGFLGMLFVLVGVIMALYTVLQAINANKDLIEELEDKDKMENGNFNKE